MNINFNEYDNLNELLDQVTTEYKKAQAAREKEVQSKKLAEARIKLLNACNEYLSKLGIDMNEESANHFMESLTAYENIAEIAKSVAETIKTNETPSLNYTPKTSVNFNDYIKKSLGI